MICPASPGSRSGNRTTALRWAAMLRALGRRVRIRAEYAGESSDILIALHARKSAPAVVHWREKFPDRPVILALTGTDLYRDLPESAEARQSIALAHRIIVLQPMAIERIPAESRFKAQVIYQ